MESQPQTETKRKYIKRKDTLKNIAEEEKKEVKSPKPEEEKEEAPSPKESPNNEEEESEDTPPPSKKIRITKTTVPSEELPSFLRGAFIKPLLLASIASASFYVNHYYRTTATTPQQPTQEPTKKKSAPSQSVQLPSSVFQTLRQASIVPGFTTTTKR
jgi:outer membrane biosynthesis protein TonB